MVSEVMLQQTQVERVIPKYKAFLKQFPNLRSLARAPLADVVTAWSGLGYNRRARFLKLASEAIVKEHQGVFPREKTAMTNLPGIGNYTAGAIRAFAFNEPEVFLETNIRSVYIHFFFSKRKSVHDKELIKYVEKTLDKRNSREWYSALMDYGSHLKSKIKNLSRRSKGYKRQAAFEGSVRQIRGNILKYMVKNGSLPINKLSFIAGDHEKIGDALLGLIKDGLVRKVGDKYQLKG
jgi:A/G-specific adenine glycosylase